MKKKHSQHTIHRPGLEMERVVSDDLDDLAGTWVHDPGFDKAITEMDRPDVEVWKAAMKPFFVLHKRVDPELITRRLP